MPCQVEQELWCIFRGDTVVFPVLFWNRDTNQPIDISNKVLFFTMKRKKNNPDGTVGDLQKKVTFPADVDSQNGMGSMMLTKEDTDPLAVNKTYFYDFQLVDPNAGPPEDVLTVGSGTVPVKQDITVSTT